MSFHDELNSKVAEVVELLQDKLSLDTGYAEYLMDAMRYSVMAPGKRIRPILMQETAKLFTDKAPADLAYFMAAIEFIHSYSLVHDDMPCIDNDEYRRGRKTTHAVYGETTALLSGDGLLNYAYETAADAFSVSDDLARTGKAMKVLTRKAGIMGMVGGQALDVLSEKTGDPLNEEKLMYIHENKTAALIEASMMIGGILGGASDEEVSRLEKAASLIGIAFQIQDDVLDVEGSFEELGKPIGSDEENNKETYVTLFGLETAKKNVLMFSQEAIDILQSFDNRNEFLLNLVESLISRKR